MCLLLDEGGLVLLVMCDYLFDVDVIGGVLLFNVWGGKLIIYCKLVEDGVS